MTADLTDVPAELRPAVTATLAAVGLEDGHLSVELVDEDRIRELNREHRGRDAPTDVLAFPIDGTGPSAGPREVGDVAICPQHCSDVVEAAVHGVLHLCGHDHETDDGEMLKLQEEIVESLPGSPGMPGREAEENAVGDLRSMEHPSPPDAEASRRGSRSSSAPASESGGGDGI